MSRIDFKGSIMVFVTEVVFFFSSVLRQLCPAQSLVKKQVFSGHGFAMGFTGSSSSLIQRDNTWVKGVDLQLISNMKKKESIDLRIGEKLLIILFFFLNHYSNH